MRTYPHGRRPVATLLAAATLATGLSAGASESLARGGGHAGGFHSFTASSIGHQMSALGRASPVAGLSTTPAPVSGSGGAPEHHHQPPPPSTSTTTTVVTTNPSSAAPTTVTSTPPVTADVTPGTFSSTSPPVTLTTETPTSTGGTLAPDTHPGGGGDTLVACMALWETGTHMTKVEWRDTCVRTLNGMDVAGGLQADSGNPSKPEQAAHVPRKAIVAHVTRQRQNSSQQ